MNPTKRLTSLGAPASAKKSRFDVDLVLLNLRNEYLKRCPCREDFPLVIVLQHQLYAYFTNRTLVDRRIEELVESGRLRAVRMGAAEDETALVDFEVVYVPVTTTDGGCGSVPSVQFGNVYWSECWRI